MSIFGKPKVKTVRKVTKDEYMKKPIEKKKDKITFNYKIEQNVQKKIKEEISKEVQKEAPKEVPRKEIKAKSEEPIDSINGMAIEDIARKLKQQELELSKKRQQVDRYKDEYEEMRKKLFPLLEQEYYLNFDIAEPIVNRYEVNPQVSMYRGQIDNPKQLLNAILDIQYCHRPEQHEMIEDMKQFKMKLTQLESSIKELHGNIEEKEKECQQLRENEQKIKEIQEKERDEVRKIVSTYKEQKTNLENIIIEKDEEIFQLKQLLKEEQEKKVEVRPVLETSEIEEIQEPEEPEVIEEIQEPEEIEIEPIEESFDLSFLEQDDEIGIEVEEEMPYIRILKEKGYVVDSSDKKEFDWFVAKEKDNKKVPLCYIYYDIEKTEEFDDIMKNTDEMYFVFDNKKRLNKGNTKFTSWLLKQQKERKSRIVYSFTTIDQLKASGLNQLDRI